MRDGRIGLIILAAGIAPALIKRSKPMARYVGDQLIRAGEYLKTGTEDNGITTPAPAQESKDSAHEVSQAAVAEEVGDGAATEPVSAEPKQQKKNPPGGKTKNPKGN